MADSEIHRIIKTESGMYVVFLFFLRYIAVLIFSHVVLRFA